MFRLFVTVIRPPRGKQSEESFIFAHSFRCSRLCLAVCIAVGPRWSRTAWQRLRWSKTMLTSWRLEPQGEKAGRKEPRPRHSHVVQPYDPLPLRRLYLCFCHLSVMPSDCDLISELVYLTKLGYSSLPSHSPKC